MHAEGAAKREQVQGGAVANPAFNAAHITATNSGAVGEGFLGQSLLFTELADSGTEFLQGTVLGGLLSLARHAPHVGVLRPFRQRLIGYNEERI